MATPRTSPSHPLAQPIPRSLICSYCFLSASYHMLYLHSPSVTQSRQLVCSNWHCCSCTASGAHILYAIPFCVVLNPRPNPIPYPRATGVLCTSQKAPSLLAHPICCFAVSEHGHCNESIYITYSRPPGLTIHIYACRFFLSGNGYFLDIGVVHLLLRVAILVFVRILAMVFRRTPL